MHRSESIRSAAEIRSWLEVAVVKLCDEGRLSKALEVVDVVVRQERVWPSVNTFSRLLKECGGGRTLVEGRRVHGHLSRSGLGSVVFLENKLMGMYGDCGSVPDARGVFDGMRERNVFSWAMIIQAYAKNGQGEEALVLFECMQEKGFRPDKVTFLSALRACAGLRALGWGKRVHAAVVTRGNGLERDIFVECTLIDTYAKCRSLEDARRVFVEMREQNVVAWNAMISGYARNNHGKQALALFQQMQQEGVQPDKVTFLCALNACASLANLECGEQVHSDIHESSLGRDISLGNALVDMYAKCGSVEKARQVFDEMPKRDVVSWSSMITGYAQHRHGEEALALFERMQQEGIKPDRVTFLGILKACAGHETLNHGKRIHAGLINKGIHVDVFVGSTLVDMYSKCGSLEDARRVLNGMHGRNIVSWNAIIAGYVQHGQGKGALAVFEEMQREGVEPDKFTFTGVLKACASLTALEQGKQIHAIIKKKGYESDVFVGSSLVDMYAKCGRIEDAWQVFNGMHEQDVVSWSAMISGCGQHGHGKEALALFKRMQQEGVKPDEVTFTSIFAACSHAGLVDEILKLFDSMSQDHGIKPTAEHYACMVDLLGRMGHLVEAENFARKMPAPPDVLVWKALLGVCRMHI